MLAVAMPVIIVALAVLAFTFVRVVVLEGLARDERQQDREGTAAPSSDERTSAERTHAAISSEGDV
jgi:hypothetical protein